MKEPEIFKIEDPASHLHGIHGTAAVLKEKLSQKDFVFMLLSSILNFQDTTETAKLRLV